MGWRPMGTTGRRSQSSRISEWPDSPPQLRASGYPGRGAGGRDDPCVLSASPQRTLACQGYAETPYPDEDQSPPTWKATQAHLLHQGLALIREPRAALLQPRGAPPTTHCPTLDCLRKPEIPRGVPPSPLRQDPFTLITSAPVPSSGTQGLKASDKCYCSLLLSFGLCL